MKKIILLIINICVQCSCKTQEKTIKKHYIEIDKTNKEEKKIYKE